MRISQLHNEKPRLFSQGRLQTKLLGNAEAIYNVKPCSLRFYENRIQKIKLQKI